MKKSAYPYIAIILAGLSLFLAGCSKAQANAGTASPGNGDSRQLPQSMQLALGTLALEGTDQAVTAEQAAALLPLWKAANSLTGADNVATEEMNALIQQIEDSMTSEQAQAIQAMDLSGESMANLASQYGFQMGGGGRGEITEEMRATMEAARASGQAPQGFGPGNAPPDGGGGFQGGGGGPPFEFRGEGPGGGGQGFIIPGDNNSGSAGSTTTVTGNPIFQAVITMLEKKVQ